MSVLCPYSANILIVHMLVVHCPYVVLMFSVCIGTLSVFCPDFVYVVRTLFVFCMYVVRMLFIFRVYVVCVLSVLCLYVDCIVSVCCLCVVYVLLVCCTYFVRIRILSICCPHFMNSLFESCLGVARNCSVCCPSRVRRLSVFRPYVVCV